MSLSVSCKTVERGEFLQIMFSIKPNKLSSIVKEEFSIDGLAYIRFQFQQAIPLKTPAKLNSASTSDAKYVNSSSSVYTSMSIKKSHSADDYKVKLNVQSESLNYYEQLVCTDHWTDWIQLGRKSVKVEKANPNRYRSIKLEVTLTASKAEVITFAKLYDDTITTDFNMSVKGSKLVVPMHRSCLLAHSEMFKTLFQSGDFVDKKEFEVGIKYVTDETIQHLKEYVYLGTVPDTGLRTLLLLAKCYLFENLQMECITKLVQMVTSHDLHSLIEFACENNIPELAIALLQRTPEEMVHQAYLKHNRKERKRHYSTEDDDDSSGSEKRSKLY